MLTRMASCKCQHMIKVRKAEQITITNDQGRLTDDEIERMIKDAENYAAEDDA